MLNAVKKSSIMSEFTEDEQKQYFEITEKKVLPHIDNIYYNVFIFGDNNDPDLMPEGVKQLLQDLSRKKAEKKQNIGEDIKLFDLSVIQTGFSIYEYHLSMPELFDIFISSYIPNEDTSRIHVQIRTRSIILEGVNASVDDTYLYVKSILDDYNLGISKVQENRIDYAYHTNIIQRPDIYLNDNLLEKSLRTDMTLIHKVGNLGRRLDWDYCGIGNRKANNVFCRIYNKSQEVVTESYKSFFIKRWLDAKMISAYDEYCYRYAYQKRSYRTGMLLGRIHWYLDYGKNENLKDELYNLEMKCNVKSDNNKYIEEQIDGVLPPVTLIMNIEFETKRKFYLTCIEYLQHFKYRYKGDPVLHDIHKVLDMRPAVCEYLTENSVCFLNDRKNTKSGMLDWWKTIHKVRIVKDENWRPWGKLYRTYERQTDIEKSKIRTKNAIAQLLMVSRDDLQSSLDATEDMSDLITILNDNDVHAMLVDTNTGKVPDLNIRDYYNIWHRKSRQYRGIIGKKEGEEK